MEFKKLRLAAIALDTLALLFLCISVSTNSWYVNQDLKGVVSSELGLWKICVYGGSGEPCTSLALNGATEMGILMLWPGWLHITKAFAFIAIFAAIMAIVGSTASITYEERCKFISQCSTQLMCISCFIAFAVFVVHMPENRPTTVYGYSFILFVLSALISLAAATLDIFINCKSSKKRPAYPA